MKEKINSINNKIIRFLGSRTWLWGDTIYSTLWRYSKDELIPYLDLIEKAKTESNCYTYADYIAWYNENHFEIDFKKLIESIDMY